MMKAQQEGNIIKVRGDKRNLCGVVYHDTNVIKTGKKPLFYFTQNLNISSILCKK